jgi:hypothetical protein
MERDEIGVVYGFRREFQCGFDILIRRLEPSIDDLPGRITVDDAADNYAHWHVRTFYARFAVMNRGIFYDSVTPTFLHVSLDLS